MSKLFEHNAPSKISNNNHSSSTSTNSNTSTSTKDRADNSCAEDRRKQVDPLKPYINNSYNNFNDRLIYDVAVPAFQVSNDPIDDRIKKNTLLINFVSRTNNNFITKYSYEIKKDPDQIEIYNMLSSMVLAREAINFLCMYVITPKQSMLTEYYNAIRDTKEFIHRSGKENYSCMIQIAAILSTLSTQGLMPINPTWGYIRTPKIDVTYTFSGISYKIETEHIIVLQSCTNFIPIKTTFSDTTFCNIFASTVGLNKNKYSSIVEWLVKNCGNYLRDTFKPSPFISSSPLDHHRAGSRVTVDGSSGSVPGILLCNNPSMYCSIMVSDGKTSYVESNVLKNLVKVYPPVTISSKNTFNT